MSVTESTSSTSSGEENLLERFYLGSLPFFRPCLGLASEGLHLIWLLSESGSSSMADLLDSDDFSLIMIGEADFWVFWVTDLLASSHF